MSFKEGQNLGFNPSLRNFFIKSSLTRCVIEPNLEVGWTFCYFHFLSFKLCENLGSKIMYAHGTCYQPT